MEKKRSAGVIIVGIFALSLGTWSLTRLAPYIFHILFHFSEAARHDGLSLVIFSIIYGVLTVCLIVSSVSFLLLKTMANVLVGSCIILGILLDFYGIGLIVKIEYDLAVLFGKFSLTGALVNPYTLEYYLLILIKIITLYLLVRSNVKEQFRENE